MKLDNGNKNASTMVQAIIIINDINIVRSGPNRTDMVCKPFSASL